jgi:hypothetical protein
MIVTIPGYSTITGRPETILKIMQEARIFEDVTGDAYIKSIQESAKRGFGITLNVDGDTYEKRAESLLRSMAENNMINIEED